MTALVLHRVLASAGYQRDWFETLREPFMRNAFLAGVLVAIAAGVIGYFVVVRSGEFSAHALGHIGFPGATGAVLIGLSPTLGLAVFCIGGAIIIGALGRHVDERATATGTILAFATGLGILFASLATKSSNTVTNVLFGNLLAVSGDQLTVFVWFTVVLLAIVAVVARPLTLASVNPEVAEAKGVPVRLLGLIFLILMGLVITMAVQVVGTLLLFALVVTPPATALRLTARPSRVVALGVAIGLLSVIGGLVLAVMFNLPPSFFIVTCSFLIWILVLAITRVTGTRPGR
ncbi:MAG: metal ABC transporter permease [Actinobacteria bacterium]|nr:metal ABC transporter permease [Actinomycetota bacterium]